MSEALRVLFVEDSPTDAKLIALALRRLGRKLDLERVEDAAAMQSALDERSWDLVISDWSMPHFSALAALELLKRSGLDLPFVIVSGTVGEDAAVEAMRAGAHDYVLKDRLTRLAPAIERELRECADRRARRAAEADLRAQQARFHAMIEKSEDGISLAARDGSVLYLSPAAARILNIAQGEGDVQGVLAAMPADERARRQERVAYLVERPGESLTFETCLMQPDGSRRWIESTVTNRLEDPAIGAFVTNFRDVTARRNAQDALHASEAWYRRIVETATEGVWMTDANGDTLFINARMAALLGRTPEEVKGRKPLDFVLEASRAAFESTLPAVRGGAQAQAEVPLVRPDGTVVWTLMAVSPVVDGAERFEGLLAMVMDLTARKRAEEALQQTEDQLRQAQKMEAVGRLAGGIAHDFNNLLSVILGFSELALSDLGPGEPLREEFEEIRQAGERATELTKQLLMFSRQQVIAPRVIDLSDVLADMDKMLRRLVGEDVELVTLPARPIGRVRVDPGSMEQVVMNLVVNARDAMPTGGKLTIETADVELDEEYARTHHGVLPGAYAMLAVTDSGVGMDKATQARIFEPFFTTKPTGKGTGLGLSTVFGIVQQSGGSVWVYSEPGIGTTFKVYLPRVDAEVDAPRLAVASALRRGAETVLVVEDESQVRAVACSILRRHGYRVIEAASAGEALLYCEQFAGAIHLLLTDVVMPQMSGPELARRLSLIRPAMRVLCMSGYTDDSVVRHGVIDAEIAYMQKPITPALLTRKVREVLDAPPAAGAPAA